MELMLEMCNDFSGAWRPSLYISMRPHLYGYGDDFEGDVKAAKTQVRTVVMRVPPAGASRGPQLPHRLLAPCALQEMREKFIADTLPIWMKYFSDAVTEHGGAFAAGPTLTIADCMWYPQLKYFTKGVADQ